MKKTKLYTFIFFFTLNGCTNTIYAPINKGTHTVSQKGQLFLSGSASFSNDVEVGLNGFMNYSPKKRIAMQAHYNVQSDWMNYGGGLGLYKSNYKASWDNTKKGFHLDVYLNYAYNIIYQLNYRNKPLANIFYHDLSIPIGLHLQQEYIGFDFVVRPHLFDIYKAEIKEQFSEKEQGLFNDYIDRPYVSSDVLARFNLGKSHFKVFCAVGVSYANKTTLYFIDPYSVSAGFNLNIGKYLKL